MDKRIEKLLNENFDEFLKEICRVDLLTREEELVLITAVQEKGLECEEADRLEKANLRFVVSLTGQYMNRGLSDMTVSVPRHLAISEWPSDGSAQLWAIVHDSRGQ